MCSLEFNLYGVVVLKQGTVLLRLYSQGTSMWYSLNRAPAKLSQYQFGGNGSSVARLAGVSVLP
jgi:hypothetical protein